jgi:hypothetical protein
VYKRQALSGCASNSVENKFDNISSVEQAIKAGNLGIEMANATKKEKDIYLKEVTDTKIPYKVFSFGAKSVGYTVLAENNRLVLLCAGFGSGSAKDFKITKENGKKVLTYKFNVGFGLNRELSGRYILGSGHAIWDSWPEGKTGFGIFLADGNRMLISDKHIKAYKGRTHEIELNAEGIKKWKSSTEYNETGNLSESALWGLHQKVFVIKIDGNEIYRGKFWAGFSSATYSGITIINYELVPTTGILKVSNGYPGPIESNEKSSIDSPEIVKHFRNIGLLKE